MIIGLDVGGTHTDVVLLGEDGPVREVKVPTKMDQLFDSVLAGIEEATSGIENSEIKRIVLSTTLTTNAVSTGNLAKAGMIICSGPGINPESYRLCENFHIISGSIDHRGREIEAVAKDEVIAAAENLKEKGIKYVGVVSKFSSRNPVQEIRIEKILSRFNFEKIFTGHKVSGNLNFPRRIATTFLNAAVFEIHKKFFEAVIKTLDQKGLDIPIDILKADGGTMNFKSSIDYPGQTILSGPAASVMGAITSAPDNHDILVLDIGGTTTDISVLIDRSPILEPVGITIDRYKTLIRSLQTRSVPLGGDSCIKVIDNEIVIGPERKGPAMGYGGGNPTPTDALFVLNKIKNGDKAKATEGISKIAEKLGLSVEEAALKIFESTCKKILKEAEKMVHKINSEPVYTVHEMLGGYKVSPKKILILGGPAKEFAEKISEISPLDTLVVPKWKVANAIGAGLAKTTCEVSLFADTEKGIIVAPEENYTKSIKHAFTMSDAESIIVELLKNKAESRGANTDDFEAEIVEKSEFNMVRGFRTTGKNIRVRAQIKPGLITGYKKLSAV